MPGPAPLLARDGAPHCCLLQLALAADVAWGLRGGWGGFILVFNLVDLASPTVAAGWSQLLGRHSAPAPPTCPSRSFTVAAWLNHISTPLLLLWKCPKAAKSLPPLLCSPGC